jgi:hypothetical protein
MHSRRILRGGLTLLSAALVWLGIKWISGRLGDESTFTGCVLLMATLSLYLLTLRKRIMSRGLGAVSVWLQLHSYAGVFASIVFLMHINWPVRGPFELCLAGCFCFVAVTGIALGIVSRVTPAKLAALKQDFALEQIPRLQYAVAIDAHHLALQSTQLGEGATLSEYYQSRLLPYFQTQRGFFYRLLPTGTKRRQLLRELEDLDRYLATEGVKQRRRLSAMVQSKDDLDYHSAMQIRLRWLYATHMALTWSLLILIGVHVVLVLRFSGTLL